MYTCIIVHTLMQVCIIKIHYKQCHVIHRNCLIEAPLNHFGNYVGKRTVGHPIGAYSCIYTIILYRSPQSTVPSSEPLKPLKDHSKKTSSKSHSAKKPSAPKEPSSSNQEQKKSSSKHSSRGPSSQKRSNGSSSVRKERTTPKT